MGVKLGAAALLLAIVMKPGVVFSGTSGENHSRLQKTTKDKLYSKEQADRGAAETNMPLVVSER